MAKQSFASGLAGVLLVSACGGKWAGTAQGSGAGAGGAPEATDARAAPSAITVGDSGSSSSPSDGGLFIDPEPPNCAGNEDCSHGRAVCTVADKCATSRGPCGPAPCAGDAYCCDAACRLDALDAPVCISAAVPPGRPCMDALGDSLPNLTARLLSDPFLILSDIAPIDVEGAVCNRGRQAVSVPIPVTWYVATAPRAGQLCHFDVLRGLSPGGCRAVRCSFPTKALPGSEPWTITLVVNDDGEGGRAIIECDYDDNSDSIQIQHEGPPP